MSIVSEGVDPPLLSIRNIESYYGAVMAIRGVSLDIHRGQIVTLLGANGAGKTTLLKSISAVLQPQKGHIFFENRSIVRQSPDAIVKRGIVHVPEGREIFPFLTIEENLMIGAYTRSGRQEKRSLAADIELVYSYFPLLKERAKQQAGYLSGGQQQMLAIGRGLMSKPTVMLLDEPSLGLSPLLVQEIMSIVKRLNEEQGVTVLLVEQNAQVALEVADYGFVMEMGRIVMAGTTEKLLNSEDIKAFYLGVSSETDKNGRGQRRWKRRKTWR